MDGSDIYCSFTLRSSVVQVVTLSTTFLIYIFCQVHYSKILVLKSLTKASMLMVVVIPYEVLVWYIS